MKQVFALLAACAAVTAALAAATGAEARWKAEATLVRPMPEAARPLIETERWRCAESECRGPVNLIVERLDGPLALSVCRDIVRKAGPVREFRMGSTTMPDAMLAECNAGVEPPRTLLARTH